MPELKHLTRSVPVSISIDVGGGDSVVVVFDRNKITPAWMRDSNIANEDNDPLSLSKMLAGVLVSWDVTNEGAEFLPVAENIALLSYPAQQALLRKILQSAVPSDAEGNASSGALSSPPTISTADSETSPNGAQTSPLQPASVSPSPT